MAGRAVGLPEGGLRLVRSRADGIFRRRWDVREHGRENVPASGRVILAGNHIGWLDGPLLFVTAPRPPHALVKEEEFAGRTGRLLRFVAQIKVPRGTDIDATTEIATRRFVDVGPVPPPEPDSGDVAEPESDEG